MNPFEALRTDLANGLYIANSMMTGIIIDIKGSKYRIGESGELRRLRPKIHGKRARKLDKAQRLIKRGNTNANVNRG
jgi:hypothetical protein